MSNDTLLDRLDMATIASCSCHTKTPQLRHHDPMCGYRLFSEASTELRDLQQTFDLQWAADMRAVKRWREAHPGNDLVLPDRANVVVWLMEQHDAHAQRAPPTPEGEYVKKVVKGLRTGQALGNEAAANLIETLYLAALPALSSTHRAPPERKFTGPGYLEQTGYIDPDVTSTEGGSARDPD